MLLPYQTDWVKDNSQIKVIEKSRRIGISWAHAAIATLDAAKARGRSSFYVGYNKEMARQFILDCAYWAKIYQAIAQQSETEIMDEKLDKSIFVYRIQFLSGYFIEALSSRPSNLRSRKGNIICDEFAFHENPDELLKAALATTTWGYKVAIISTHNGRENRFNTLIRECDEGKWDYSCHKTNFSDAIAQGLYKRICLIENEVWSAEKEKEWERKIRDFYGIAGSEELDCEPLDVKGGGKVFQKEWFNIIPAAIAPDIPYKVRFWDMAASEKKQSYYTASVLMGGDGENIYIYDAIAQQLGPTEGDEWMQQIAIADGNRVAVRWELEGGSAGLKVEEYLRSRLQGYDASGVKPRGDKVSRALPFASAAKRGEVYLVAGEWNERYLNALYAFDGTAKPLVNDLTDASSGAWDAIDYRPAGMLFT